MRDDISPIVGTFSRRPLSVEPHLQWLRVPPTMNVPLLASERQSGWVLGCRPRRKSVKNERGRRVSAITWVWVASSRFLSSQYSSGSRTVVALRSASVMIQILVPLLRV